MEYAHNTTYNSAASGTWVAPQSGQFYVETWGGGGGAGHYGRTTSAHAAGGGGGGAYAATLVTAVSGTGYSYYIAAGGANGANNASGNNGGNTHFNNFQVRAGGGIRGMNTGGGGAGGSVANSSGTIVYTGGAGAGNAAMVGGGGGGSGGNGGNGGGGGNGAPPNAGSGNNGGAGGSGGASNLAGSSGSIPGGGGGSAGGNLGTTFKQSGSGNNGKIIISYNDVIASSSSSGVAATAGTLTAKGSTTASAGGVASTTANLGIMTVTMHITGTAAGATSTTTSLRGRVPITGSSAGVSSTTTSLTGKGSLFNSSFGNELVDQGAWYTQAWWDNLFGANWSQSGSTLVSNGTNGFLSRNFNWQPGTVRKVIISIIANDGTLIFPYDGSNFELYSNITGTYTYTYSKNTYTDLYLHSYSFNGSITALSIKEIFNYQTGSSIVSGILQGKISASGVVAGVASDTASLSGKGALPSSSSAGSASTSVTLRGLGAASGNSPGVATTSGTLSPRAFMTASSTGVGTTAGSIRGKCAISGASDGVATTAGTLRGKGKAKRQELGAELIVNQTFNDGSWWIHDGYGWYFNSGEYAGCDGNNYIMESPLILTEGHAYRVTFDIVYSWGVFQEYAKMIVSTSGLNPTLPGTYVEVEQPIGQYTYDIIAAGETIGFYLPLSGDNIEIDNVSVREIIIDALILPKGKAKGRGRLVGSSAGLSTAYAIFPGEEVKQITGSSTGSAITSIVGRLNGKGKLAASMLFGITDSGIAVLSVKPTLKGTTVIRLRPIHKPRIELCATNEDYSSWSSILGGDVLLASTWNDYFNLPEYGSPITSVEMKNGKLILYGGKNIILSTDNNEAFYPFYETLYSIEDFGCIEALEYYVFYECEYMVIAELPFVKEITGSEAFEYCYLLGYIDLSSLETCDDDNDIFYEVAESLYNFTIKIPSHFNKYTNLFYYIEPSNGFFNKIYSDKLGLQICFYNLQDSLGYLSLDGSLEDWNTFFDLPAYGEPFTSVEYIGNTVILRGSTGLELREHIFDEDETDPIEITAIHDLDGIVSRVGDFAFYYSYNSSYFNHVSLPVCTEVGESAFEDCDYTAYYYLPRAKTFGAYAFEYLTNYNQSRFTIDFEGITEIPHSFLQNGSTYYRLTFPNAVTVGSYAFSGLSSYSGNIRIDLPKAESIGSNAFQSLGNNASSNFTLDISSCTDLGGSVLNNDVFLNLDGQNIFIKVNNYLMSCNSGAPDGDLQYIMSNKTVKFLISGEASILFSGEIFIPIVHIRGTASLTFSTTLAVPSAGGLSGSINFGFKKDKVELFDDFESYSEGELTSQSQWEQDIQWAVEIHDGNKIITKSLGTNFGWLKRQIIPDGDNPPKDWDFAIRVTKYTNEYLDTYIGNVSELVLQGTPYMYVYFVEGTSYNYVEVDRSEGFADGDLIEIKLRNGRDLTFYLNGEIDTKWDSFYYADGFTEPGHLVLVDDFYWDHDEYYWIGTYAYNGWLDDFRFDYDIILDGSVIGTLTNASGSNVLQGSITFGFGDHVNASWSDDFESYNLGDLDGQGDWESDYVEVYPGKNIGVAQGESWGEAWVNIYADNGTTKLPAFYQEFRIVTMPGNTPGYDYLEYYFGNQCYIDVYNTYAYFNWYGRRDDAWYYVYFENDTPFEPGDRIGIGQIGNRFIFTRNGVIDEDWYLTGSSPTDCVKGDSGIFFMPCTIYWSAPDIYPYYFYPPMRLDDFRFDYDITPGVIGSLTGIVTKNITGSSDGSAAQYRIKWNKVGNPSEWPSVYPGFIRTWGVRAGWWEAGAAEDVNAVSFLMRKYGNPVFDIDVKMYLGESGLPIVFLANLGTIHASDLTGDFVRYTLDFPLIGLNHVSQYIVTFEYSNVVTHNLGNQIAFSTDWVGGDWFCRTDSDNPGWSTYSVNQFAYLWLYRSPLGIIHGHGRAVASSSGVASTSGILTRRGVISASSLGAASCSAVLHAHGTLTVIVTGISSVSGLLLGKANLLGVSAGIASLVANLTSKAYITGITSGVTSTNASLGGKGSISGLIIAIAIVTGETRGRGSLKGSELTVFGSNAVISWGIVKKYTSGEAVITFSSGAALKGRFMASTVITFLVVATTTMRGRLRGIDGVFVESVCKNVDNEIS